MNRQRVLEELEYERQLKIQRENELRETIKARQEFEAKKREIQNDELLNEITKSFYEAGERKQNYINTTLKGHMLSHLKEEEAKQAKIRNQKRQEFAAKKLEEKYRKDDEKIKTAIKEKEDFFRQKKALQAEFNKEKEALLKEFEKKKRQIEYETSQYSKFQRSISPNKSFGENEFRASTRSISPISRPKTAQQTRGTQSTQTKSRQIEDTRSRSPIGKSISTTKFGMTTPNRSKSLIGRKSPMGKSSPVKTISRPGDEEIMSETAQRTIGQLRGLQLKQFAMMLNDEVRSLQNVN